MIRIHNKLLAAVVIFSTVALAQTQIATVMSDGPFKLRGANITPGQGVPAWPVVAGDVIRSGNSLVVISFADGSSVTLAPNSVARIETNGNAPAFHLEAGNASYALKAVNSVQLFAGNAPIIPTSLTGGMQFSNAAPTGSWTASHTGLVLGGTVATAGAVLGIGLTQKSKSTTP